MASSIIVRASASRPILAQASTKAAGVSTGWTNAAAASAKSKCLANAGKQDASDPRRRAVAGSVWGGGGVAVTSNVLLPRTPTDDARVSGEPFEATGLTLKVP